MRITLFIILFLAQLAAAQTFFPDDADRDFIPPGLEDDYAPPELAFKLTVRPAKDLYYDCKMFIAEVERSKDRQTFSDKAANHRCLTSFEAWKQAAAIQTVGRSENAIRVCLPAEHEYGGTLGLIQVFIDYVDKNPNSWMKEAQTVAYESLKRNFRCVYRLP